MGRKTYESIPLKFRPLPGRHNYILSRQNPHYEPTPPHFHTQVFQNFDDIYWAHDFDGITSKLKIFVIGGAEIYGKTLSFQSGGLLYVNEIIATEIDGEFDGETFFPAPNYNLWQRKVLKKIEQDEKNSHNAEIVRYWR